MGPWFPIKRQTQIGSIQIDLSEKNIQHKNHISFVFDIDLWEAELKFVVTTATGGRVNFLLAV